MGDGVGDFAFWIAMGLGQFAFWSAMGPIIKAFARRIDAKTGPGDERVMALEARLADLEQRGLTSGEVEAQFHRLAEVEERLDFAERMITRTESSLPAAEG
ncbi:MAG: hypothetical protein ABIZ70_00670 [Gemmatimonadales bacterium]